jgi:hypothetical protein
MPLHEAHGYYQQELHEAMCLSLRELIIEEKISVPAEALTQIDQYFQPKRGNIDIG